MNHDELKKAVARAARDCGVDGYEINISSVEKASAEAQGHELSTVSYSRAGTMSVRCVKEGKSGYATSELVSPETAAELVERAAANALVVDDADVVGLFAGSESYTDPQESMPDMPDAEMMKAHTMELQEKIFSLSDKIVEGSSAWTASLAWHNTFLNSAGLDLSYECGLVYHVAGPAVKDGDDAANEYRVMALDRESIEETAAKGVEAALAKLGADSVHSGKYGVIMSAEAMRSLISTFAPVFSARSAYMKTTLLAGKEGEMVAGEKFTLTDDPFHPDKFNHCPFDAEGVAVYKKNVIEKGELKTLLYNRMYAELLGKETTGNAVSAKGIGAKGLYVAAGDDTEDALLARLGDGLYIDRLEGLHAGANVQSGDFSLQAEGFLVEGGKKTRPIKNFTIADNFFTFLKKAEEMSDKVEFETGSNYGAPNVLFRDVSVSGK